MNRTILIGSILIMNLTIACSTREDRSADGLFEKENLLAWCIVPFDASDRTPLERAEMLNELGITQLAYDYRDRHIPSFAGEIEILKQHRIKLRAVWLWVDPANPLSEATSQIIEIVEESGTRTEFWVGMPEGAFDGLPDEESLSIAVETLKIVQDRVKMAGCKMALYNHGGWYGEPGNQVRIIEALRPGKVKIVYNFHHGHHQIRQFPELLEQMLPYLSCININGMKAEGPKILTLGDGDQELEMLKVIQASGYDGPIGILGHTEGEDIRPVLERNLAGLEILRSRL